MLDPIASALHTEGLWIMLCGAFLAGLVRGFSGFGTAMIYLPFAALVVSPLWAILSLLIMDILGPVPLIKPALKQAKHRDLVLLLIGSLCLLPIGLALLSVISQEGYRYFISVISLGMLLCLICGVRYRGEMKSPLILSVGALSGFSGGLGGVPGPPVILFYMSSRLPVQIVRANVLLFLFLNDFLIFTVVGLRGELSLLPLILGLLMVLPNGIGNLIGAAIFNPDKAGLYKSVAYITIAASAIMALPLWSP